MTNHFNDLNDSKNRICITGMGMVSSLGNDVLTCCAAARAGVLRTTELDYFQLRSSIDGEKEAGIGNCVPLLTEGFEGYARLLRLTQAGLTDLRLQSADGFDTLALRANFYLSFPDPMRIHTGLDIVVDEGIRQTRLEEAEEAREDSADSVIPQKLFRKASRLAGWPSDVNIRHIGTSGHSGVAEALHRALIDLRNGTIQVAVVGGIDSLLDENVLWWLESTGRMKCDAVAVGLSPGEAAAFIVIECLERAHQEGRRVLSIVDTVEFAEEEHPLLKGSPASATGLSRVLSSALEKLSLADQNCLWIITDQNGEPYRAMEWGYCLVRLLARWSSLREPVLWYPAALFGDTAAASGVVAMCLAIRAFDRGYWPSAVSIIVSSSDGPLRTAIVISKK